MLCVIIRTVSSFSVCALLFDGDLLDDVGFGFLGVRTFIRLDERLEGVWEESELVLGLPDSIYNPNVCSLSCSSFSKIRLVKSIQVTPGVTQVKGLYSITDHESRTHKIPRRT